MITAWKIEEITAKLAALDTWRKQFFWWPTMRWTMQDPIKRAFCREAARLSQSIGVGVHSTAGVDHDAIDAAVATIQGLPAWVQWCISAQPYHYVAGSGIASEWGEPHDQDLSYFGNGLRLTLESIRDRQAAAGMANRVGMIWLDTEQADLQANGDPDHDQLAANKFNVARELAESLCSDVLGYVVPVTWYSHRAVDLRGTWRNASQTPPGVVSACACPSLYQWEDPHLCVEIFNRTVARVDAEDGPGVNYPVCPAIGLCGGYMRQWNEWANAGTLVETREYPRLHSWLAGRYIQMSPWLNDDESGLFNRASYGFMWPGMLPDGYKYWPLHFLAFAHGAANIPWIPDGEPA